MDAMEAILTRRSVREYTNKTISDKIMKELIEAGFSAPSAGDQQPWHFIIIDDRKLLDKIPEFHPHAKMLLDCQKAILVCGDLNLETHNGFWMLDCSAATENILIAARAKRLGACWLGVYPREGRISGFRKISNKFRLMQITAPISPGSSGGPIINQKGKVIGIASASIMLGQNLNFAVPSKKLAEIISKPKLNLPFSKTNLPSRKVSALNQSTKGSDLVKAFNVSREWPYKDALAHVSFSVKNSFTLIPFGCDVI